MNNNLPNKFMNILMLADAVFTNHPFEVWHHKKFVQTIFNVLSTVDRKLEKIFPADRW